MSSTRSSDSAKPSDGSWAAFACAALAALVPVVALWDFTVDDALIAARYALNVTEGWGYRLNPSGAVTDGVTPLGWPWLVAISKPESVLEAWWAAKWMGAMAWLLGAGFLGLALQRLATNRQRWWSLSLLVVCSPLAAWSVAGMETGVVLGLAASATACRVLRPRLAAPLGGLVAAWRPEALPWALCGALLDCRNEKLDGLTRARRFIIALAPAAMVALVRLLFFGRLTPLSLSAKQPVLVLGVRYSVACLLLTGVLAAVSVRGVPRWVRGLQAMIAVHLLAIAMAGGDWMPLSRLVVIALPAVILAAGELMGRQRPAWSVLRLTFALAGLVFVSATVGPKAARVGQTRLKLIDQATPRLSKRCGVATVDIGWVGASTKSRLLDLAGVTDPDVAALPGGHTSRPIPMSLLEARGIDTVLMRLQAGTEVASPWHRSRFAYATDGWLAPRIDARWAPRVQTITAGRLTYLLVEGPSTCVLPAKGQMR